MTEQFYEAISRPFRESPRATAALRLTSKALTVLGYVAYPVLLVLVALVGNWEALSKFIVVPAVGFAILSIFRARYNAPRPYEVLPIEPLIQKDTVGRSFPSRHTFSLMMIACSWCVWLLLVGIVLIICACALGIIRVIAGVHFPRDVIVGALFAVVCALIGYGLIL